MADWQKCGAAGEILKSINSRGLLVCFRGMRGDNTGALRKFCEAQHGLLPDIDILLLENFKDGVIGFKRPEVIAQDALCTIDACCVAVPYEEIRFLAYSMGAVIARKVLIDAFATNSKLSKKRQRDWHHKVTRLVNAAGYARGWIVSPRMNGFYQIAFNLLSFFGHIMSLFTFDQGRRGFLPTLFTLRRGAPFIFNTRIQWLALTRASNTLTKNFKMVHLMPSNDSFISTVEIIDIEMNLVGSKVTYVQIPDSDHDSILDLTHAPKRMWRTAQATTIENSNRSTRVALIQSALCGAPNFAARKNPFHLRHALSLKQIGLETKVEYLDDKIEMKSNPKILHLVYIIHGIRDTGVWAKKLGMNLRMYFDSTVPKADRGKLITDTQSYGYFTALPFLFPWIRRTKVEWLMDRYATAKAFYPSATFSFMGHSNGTYLAASALENYEMVKFEKLVFAGSVVRSNFDWDSLIDQKRVGAVVNYVATSDVVVAFFPRAAQRLFRKFFDLGGAGHDGFNASHLVKNIRYVKGDHAAAIDEHHWQFMSQFIVDEVPPLDVPIPSQWFASQQTLRMKGIAFLAPLLLVLCVATLALFSYSLVAPILNIQTINPVSKVLIASFGRPQWLNYFLNFSTSFWCAYAGLAKVFQALITWVFFKFVHWVLWRW